MVQCRWSVRGARHAAERPQTRRSIPHTTSAPRSLASSQQAPELLAETRYEDFDHAREDEDGHQGQ